MSETKTLKEQRKENMSHLLGVNTEIPLPNILNQPANSQSQKSQKQEQKNESHSGPKAQASNTQSKGTGTTRGKESDYKVFFENRFGPLVLLVIWAFTGSIDKANLYAPTPDECSEIAPYAARLSVRVEDFFKLPKFVHEAVVSSDDIVSCGLVLLGYLDRVGILARITPYFTNRSNHEQSDRPFEKVQTARETKGNNGNVNLSSIPGLGHQWLDQI